MKARACGATRRSALSRWMGLVAESVLVQFLCQVENPAGQLRVLCKQIVDVRVVGVGLLLLEDGLTVLAVITNVERKIASRDTMRVSVGQGLFSMNSIHAAKTSACR